MKKKILIVISILFYSLLQAQKTLPYNHYIDYYRENVKSTILTKQGDFLKDGKYKFKGNANDFRFLLSYILKYNIEDFQPSDSLIYEGEIKDSLKVNVWQLILNRKNNPIDLIYHKKHNVVIKGVNFNENNYGLVNEIIDLKRYNENGNLYFMNRGWEAIRSLYNFGRTDYYSVKEEYYDDKKNKIINYFEIIDKKNNTTHYYEKLSYVTKVNLQQAQRRYYNKESFFRYNDSCSLEIKTEMLTLKDKKKINKYIYQNIENKRIRKKKASGDMAYPDKTLYIKVNVSEGIKDDKLIELKFDFQNKDAKCPFTEFLKTNYYPIILYDVSRIE